VSGPDESNGWVEPPAEGSSVLANLPRTRPQRATARRTAARRSGEAESAQRTKMAAPAGVADSPAKPVKPVKAAKPPAMPKAARQRAAPGRRSTSARMTEPVPRQGFECEGEEASGPVAPPGGFELVAAAVELAGELAKSGIIGGERLLRDVLARLPGS
jgi:hypothetical protein